MVRKQYKKEGYNLCRSPQPIKFTDKFVSLDFDPYDIPGWSRSLEGNSLVINNERERE